MGIIEKNKDGILYYQFERIKDINYINHLFTSKIGWNNKNIYEKISELFAAPRDNIIGVQQVHGTDIMVIDSKIKDFQKLSNLKVDGLMTNIPNIVLTTYHADCVPIYFLDKVKKVVGIAHSGWKGTYNNIGGKMIDVMKNTYNSSNEDILIGIGPSIGPCCYEVSKDLGEEFASKYKKFDNIIEERENRVFLDLWRINYLQINQKGIPRENIIVSKICTSCEVDRFHSYRREKGTQNRMVAAIGLNTKFRNL